MIAVQGIMQDRPESRDIHAYLAFLEAEGTHGLERGPAVRLLRRVTSPALRDAAKVRGTGLLAPIARRRARTIAAGRTDLLLHLGCGTNKLPGWVNIDLLGYAADIPWNLLRALPFPTGCARAAFLEHVIEHFTLADSLTLLEECRRVLRPGGVIRIGVPDLGRYMRSYAGDRALIDQARPDRPTPLLAVAEVAQSHGHQSAYDAETLILLLREAGFRDVAIRGFRESTALDPVPDMEARRIETVYAEGTGPVPATQ
jgi:predicted SAM-dependent methyltransferase